ncbi:MAG: DUF5654 family protein [Patescibacteria group bacterium]
METPEEKKKKSELRREIRSRTIGYIVGAFGLVAGLAWNDAVKSAIDNFYKVDGGGIGIRFIYAIVITLVVVIVSYYVSKWGMPKE